MKVHTFTAPDGSKFRRRSRRTYTHAILYREGARGDGTGKWKLGSCIGRPDLVAARLETWGKGSPDTIAVPADE